MIFSRIKGVGFLHKGSISFLSYCTHVGVWERSQVIQRQGAVQLVEILKKNLVITAGKKKLSSVDGSVTLWAEHL